jgi:hypothetical protein
MRLRRLTSEQRARLFATRRTLDLSGTPARVSINAIENELAAIERAEVERNSRRVKQ